MRLPSIDIELEESDSGDSAMRSIMTNIVSREEGEVGTVGSRGVRGGRAGRCRGGEGSGGGGGRSCREDSVSGGVSIIYNINIGIGWSSPSGWDGTTGAGRPGLDLDTAYNSQNEYLPCRPALVAMGAGVSSRSDVVVVVVHQSTAAVPKSNQS